MPQATRCLPLILQVAHYIADLTTCPLLAISVSSAFLHYFKDLCVDIVAFSDNLKRPFHYTDWEGNKKES